MSIVVTNCGRSGTNMLLEILRCSPSLKASEFPEDKAVYTRGIKYPIDYLTKCDTVYFSYEHVKKTLELNPHMLVLWPIRDPRDMVLSKLYRGWKVADDATPYGCITDMYYAFGIYMNIVREFEDRISVWWMEDFITDTEEYCNKLCRYFNIEYNDKMVEFYKHMRQNEKKRYNNIDKSQVSMYSNWRNIYDKFFVKQGINVIGLFKAVEPITRYFGYK